MQLEAREKLSAVSQGPSMITGASISSTNMDRHRCRGVAEERAVAGGPACLIGEDLRTAVFPAEAVGTQDSFMAVVAGSDRSAFFEGLVQHGPCRWAPRRFERAHALTAWAPRTRTASAEDRVGWGQLRCSARFTP